MQVPFSFARGSVVSERITLILFLLVFSGYFLVAVNWGLPAWETWAPDEIVPALFRSGFPTWFAGGWHTQYPPFHFFLLSFLYSPFLLAGFDSDLILALVGRGLSVLMGVGSLFFLYKIGRSFQGHWWALLGVCLFAFTPQALYYSKIANVDVPYLFWLLASLFVFSRVLNDHRTRDYLLFVVLAMAGICTKEQAYAFYVLLVPVLFYARFKSAAVSRKLFDPVLLWSSLVALLSFGCFQGLFFGFESFLAHFHLITGAKFQGYKMFPQTVLGHIELLCLSIKELAFVTSIPVLVTAILGVLLAVVKRGCPWWLLLSVLSYQLFFIHVAFYAYDRFFIPVAAILSLSASWGLSSFHSRAPRAVVIVSVILLLFQFARGAEFTLLMYNDTRFRAEAWMSENIPKDRTLGLFGYQRYLPRQRGFTKRKSVSFWPDQFSRVRNRIDCLVMNYIPPRLWGRNHPAKAFMLMTRSGKFGTAKIFSARERVLGTLVFNPRAFLGESQSRFSNLAKVSPPVRIYSVDGRCGVVPPKARGLSRKRDSRIKSVRAVT